MSKRVPRRYRTPERRAGIRKLQVRAKFGPTGEPAPVVVKRMGEEPYIVHQGRTPSFGDRLRVLGYDSYPAYLASNHWANVRREWAASGRAKCCAVCGHGRYELHHHSYRRLGRESLDDLTPLCRTCHGRAHALVGKTVHGAKVRLSNAALVLAQPCGLAGCVCMDFEVRLGQVAA